VTPANRGVAVLTVVGFCFSAAPQLAARRGQVPPTPPPAQTQQSQGQPDGQAGARQSQAAAIAAAAAAAANPGLVSAQVQGMFDAFVLQRSKDFLALDNQQYPLFFQLMIQLQQLRIRHQQQRSRMLNELRKLTNPQAPEVTDDGTLDARTKALDSLESQMQQDEQKAIAALDSVLTVRQRARFRIFEENMEREKIRMLALALQTAPVRGPNPPQPSVPGQAGS
jgi:Spy/CpxP family protein refolding chaperone